MTVLLIEPGTLTRIRSDNPVTTASADKLTVLASAESRVTKGRAWTLVENEWGIVQAMDATTLEAWPADAA